MRKRRMKLTAKIPNHVPDARRGNSAYTMQSGKLNAETAFATPIATNSKSRFVSILRATGSPNLISTTA